jgi:hypothetical protein
MQSSSRQPFLAKALAKGSLAILIAGAGFSINVTAAEEKSAPQAPPKWPTSFKPSRAAAIKLIQKGGGGQSGQEFIYQTKHFELRSPTVLSQHNLSHFATTAESVPSVLALLPLPLLGMPKDAADNDTLGKVLIYPNEEAFLKAGGTHGAAGYYSGRKQAIMLRADTFLSPPPRAGSRLPPKANYDLLVHEFTHLCMHRDLAYLPVWFTEGTAEYIAASHENKGVYQFSNITSSIRKHILKNLPQDKEFVVLPGIVETMSLTHKTWKERIETGFAKDHYRSYATSLLIIHTLFHGGEKRLTTTRNFLDQIHARKRHSDPIPVLIPPSDRIKLQEMIIKYWKPRGLRLKFSPTPSAP